MRELTKLYVILALLSDDKGDTDFAVDLLKKEIADLTAPKVKGSGSAKKVTRDDVVKVVDAWNEMCKRSGLNPVKTMAANSQRFKSIVARINEHGLDIVLQAIEIIPDCSFLCGKAGQRPFTASIEWVMKPNNFPKVYEGKYLDRDKSAKRKPALPQAENPEPEMSDEEWLKMMQEEG